jgi:hypothetical protein
VIKFTSCLSMVGGSLWYPFKIAHKCLKNNLRRPFENCEFSPQFYRITYSFFIVIYHKRKTTCIYVCYIHVLLQVHFDSKSTCEKHVHKRIIPLRGDDWAQA